MSDKTTGSKRLIGTRGASLDSELGEARAQLAASEHTRRTLEDLAKQKVEEVQVLQQKVNETEQRIKDIEAESHQTNSEIQRQLEDMKLSKDNLERISLEKEQTIQSLERQMKTANEDYERIQSQEAMLRNELRVEKERTRALKSENQQKEKEKRDLAEQLTAALRDLKAERETRSKAEEGRSMAEMRVEELIATLEEVQITNEEEKTREKEKTEDLWKQRTQYIYVAAFSACATAAVVSIVFRHYTKH